MKLTIETVLRLDTRETDAFTVAIETAEIVKIANASGPAAANNAIDGFVSKYTEQLKAKLAKTLNK
jgi:hypothetical protein